MRGRLERTHFAFSHYSFLPKSTLCAKCPHAHDISVDAKCPPLLLFPVRILPTNLGLAPALRAIGLLVHPFALISGYGGDGVAGSRGIVVEVEVEVEVEGEGEGKGEVEGEAEAGAGGEEDESELDEAAASHESRGARS